MTAVGWLSCHLVKALVARPRPDQSPLADPLITAPATHSFPSGQVCLATALAFALYYLARRTPWPRPVLGFGIVIVFVVALSRLYLGVHYPADVLASIATTSCAILYFTGPWNRYATAIIGRIRLLAWFGPIPSQTGVAAADSQVLTRASIIETIRELPGADSTRRGPGPLPRAPRRPGCPGYRF
ncbi:phosphatase PAP2 family protein [Pseudarthrobacter sp. NPDC058119]|uniref:phosphatase PAP2 family protein n=1 Tax=Pseudarthrobacter sp. NPDC058119 TaxID=3346348 RepID=UPI0036D9E288